MEAMSVLLKALFFNEYRMCRGKAAYLVNASKQIFGKVSYISTCSTHIAYLTRSGKEDYYFAKFCSHSIETAKPVCFLQNAIS